ESGGRLERHGRQRSSISAPGTRGKEGRREWAVAAICAVAIQGQAAVVLLARRGWAGRLQPRRLLLPSFSFRRLPASRVASGHEPDARTPRRSGAGADP